MTNAFEHLAGLGTLKAWLAKNLPLFRENHSLAPRAIVLAGLPGTGKRSISKAIASELHRPLVIFRPGNNLDPTTVTLIEDLHQEHLPLIQRLADPAESMPFVIAMTERPWELPAGLFRPDTIESIWHLDLPNLKERAEVWDLAAKHRESVGLGFDNVILARDSHELALGEINAAFDRAIRKTYPKEPREKHLLEALVDILHFGSTKHEDLSRMTAWAVRHAVDTRIGTSPHGAFRGRREIFFAVTSQ